MKKNTYLIAVVSLITGFGVGFFIASNSRTGDNMMLYDKRSSKQELMENHYMETHDKLDVSEPSTAPTISLSVERDPMSGYNVHITTSNFTFTPENAGLPPADNEGHAHLYVNGKKIARMYSPWYHISLLDSGENEIRVTLNTNDHKEYAIDDKTIEDTVILQVTEEEHNQTPHSH